MAGRRTTRGRGPLAQALHKLILGGAFVGMGSYFLNEVLGTWWPPDVLALWGPADDPGDRFAIVLISFFQWTGALMVVTALLGLVRAVRGGNPDASEAEGGGQEASAPWLRHPDWAQGRAEAVGDGRGRPRLVLFAIVNLVFWPGAVWASRDILADDTTSNGMLLLIWLFPVVVGIVLVGKLRQLATRVRFGRSVFELDTLPGEVGGYLAGRLRTRIEASQAPEEGFEVHLTAYRRTVTRSSDGSRKVDNMILYRDEQWVRGVPDTGSGARDSGSGTGKGMLEVPVVFAIPDDAPSTDPSSGVRWGLEVRARIPGLDYRTVIPVPVYRTGGAPASEGLAASGADGPALSGAVPEPGTPAKAGEPPPSGAIPAAPAFLAYREHRLDPPASAPTTAGVKVALDAGGRLQELRVGARAGLVSGMTLLIGALMFLGAVPVAWFSDDAPSWVVPICLVSGLFLVLFGLHTLTTSTVLRFDAGAVRFKKGPFGLGATNTIPYPRLEGADVRATGGQVGSRAEYALSLVLRDGERIRVTTLLRSRPEADRLARLAQERIDAGAG